MGETHHVDLDAKEWAVLQPQNISAFTIDEQLVRCEQVYPSGVLPGATRVSGKQLQRSHVRRFDNFIEGSKIMESETRLQGKDRYLLAKFFQKRASVWKAKYTQSKEGIIVGYYHDGMILHPNNAMVRKIVFLLPYHDIIRRLPVYTSLLTHLRKGGKISFSPKILTFLPVYNEELGNILHELLAQDLKEIPDSNHLKGMVDAEEIPSSNNLKKGKCDVPKGEGKEKSS